LLKPPRSGARKIFFENRMLFIGRVPLKKSFNQTIIFWLINLQLSFLPFNKFKTKKLGGAVGTCTYIIILSKFVFAFACYSCPYHTKMNKWLVPECSTIIDVRSFTVSYKVFMRTIREKA
jgi:hypothetical protein